jgi:uncharacterized protein (TIGR01777 family)
VIIILAGGTGFLGSALQTHFRRSGHIVRVLTRQPADKGVPRTGGQSPNTGTVPPAEFIGWQPDGTAGDWARELDGADAVINLSGAGIADARWTAARKITLRDSRVLPTRSLASAVRLATRPPVLVNVCGINYYGPRGEDILDETAPAGSDFLARLCVEWEGEAERVADVTRVAILRSGAVLHPSGGVLQKLLLPFRLGVGGRLGSGRQYLPWIHLGDWLELVTFIASTPAARGPFNVTAPEPTTNTAFTRALGRALRRPTIFPVPSVALRLALGELADILLTGQRAVPAHARRLGFSFRFPSIEVALQDLLR